MNGRMIKAALAGMTGSLVLFNTAWSQQLPPEDIKKVKEAIPYVVLSKEIYEHKVENDSNRDLKVGNWERIQSTRASFKEAYNEASTTDLVNKLSRDGSLSAEDIRQIQINDGKLDSDIAAIFAPNDPISFYAEVYKNGGGKRVIVFEGTGSLEDWIADFAHVRKMPDQYKKGLEFTNKIIQTCGCNKNDIVVTGHSLGGGLAQYVAMSVEANVKAYTFNPAGLWDSTAVSIDTGKAANITNFIADGYLYSDVVSKTGVVFGKKIPVVVR